MLKALALSFAQLGDRRIVAILAKSLAITLALFVALGAAGWWGLDALLDWLGLNRANLAEADDLRGLASLVLALIGAILLWRILALAVLQFFADEVVEAVEARHYPAALAQARKLDWREELANGLKGAGRALLYNGLALPVALVLLVTGVGAPLVFWLVNAVLLGRELTDMVWLRHRHAPDAPPPVRAAERLALGGMVALLLTLPFAGLLAPVMGAAMATHLVHRRKGPPHAT